MKYSEIFKPGLKHQQYYDQAVHVGSQSVGLQEVMTTESEQAYEGRHMSLCKPGDVMVARTIDLNYLDYWQGLIEGKVEPVCPKHAAGDLSFLSTLLLNDKDGLKQVKDAIDGNTVLLPFSPTVLEEGLSQVLNINFWGKSGVSGKYGVKTGGIEMAKACGIPLAPGFCLYGTKSINEAVDALSYNGHKEGVVKLDLSLGGMGSWKFTFDTEGVRQVIQSMMLAGYNEGDGFVIESWLDKQKVIGTHLEITPDGKYYLCAAWEQKVEGTSYVGAVPLDLSDSMMSKLVTHLKSLGEFLVDKGAVGSHGPDFMLVGNDMIFNEDNARIPATAIPLEIALVVNGYVPSGFMASHISLPIGTKFQDVQTRLAEKKLLITKPDSLACGVVPFNVGLLPWGKMDMVALASDIEKAVDLINATKEVLK
jgi:hypothetical protein